MNMCPLKRNPHLMKEIKNINKTNIAVSLFLIISTTLNSCNRCKNVTPPIQYFELSIVDVNNTNLLGTTYNETSFKLYNNYSEIWLNYGPTLHGEVLRIEYAQIETNAKYYLELSSTDTDTIKVDFNTTEEKCYDVYDIQSFQYNGQSLNYDKGVQYKIVK